MLNEDIIQFYEFYKSIMKDIYPNFCEEYQVDEDDDHFDFLEVSREFFEQIYPPP